MRSLICLSLASLFLAGCATLGMRNDMVSCGEMCGGAGVKVYIGNLTDKTAKAKCFCGTPSSSNEEAL